MRIVTFGHGAASEAELATLIRDAELEAVVDVRSVPKSRAHPHAWAERMAQWIPDLTGAAYTWERNLGGFRKMKPDSPNTGLRNASFRGYADYMQTSEFRNALDELLQHAADRSTAIMCSESLWWRCHRRLIADALAALHGVEVQHLMHNGTLQAHRLTPGATISPDGTLCYEVTAS